MWKCTNCNHVELGTEKPEHCTLCGADAQKLVSHEIPGIKGQKTPRNLKTSFVAESQAHVRNLAFAVRAEEEGYPQLAKLFRAVAEAEAVHAFNYLRLMGTVADTQENLQTAFERENLASSTYPEFIKEANSEGNEQVAISLSYSRDVERGHATGSMRKRCSTCWGTGTPNTTSAAFAAMCRMAFCPTSVPSVAPRRASSAK